MCECIKVMQFMSPDQDLMLSDDGSTSCPTNDLIMKSYRGLKLVYFHNFHYTLFLEREMGESVKQFSYLVKKRPFW